MKRPHRRTQDQHQPQSSPPPRHPRAAALRGDLTQLLRPGDTPLDDERLCRCGHLEADHRMDGPCSRCKRCQAPSCDVFWTPARARDDDDVTLVDACAGEGRP